MNNENNSSLIPVINDENVITTLEQINLPLNTFVKANGLPTNNVLASNIEKTRLFNNFSLSISTLSPELRETSDYLTKFIVAGAVGLFDGALNYLWDEVIRTLRNKIIEYDLRYFYSVAEQFNPNYKKLNDEKDLECISDHDLLQILLRISILDDIAFHALENMNYLRNNASAAHPNVNELTGIKLASLLEEGIRYAITLKIDASSIKVKELFNNIRTISIPSEDYEEIANDLKLLPQNRLDDFMLSIFGLYCDLNSQENTRNNILGISKLIWSNVSEQIKHRIGAKYGYYRKNAAVQQKDLVNKYLEFVGGTTYKDDDSIVADLIDKLAQLKSVHFGMNNFYNEAIYARDILDPISHRSIPAAIRKDLVKTIGICYAGNGNGFKEGVDEDAVIIYEKIISSFGDAEIKDFILLFKDMEFVIDFGKTKVQSRVKQLCNILKIKTTNRDLIEGLDMLIKSSNVQKVSLTSEYHKIEEKIDN